MSCFGGIIWKTWSRRWRWLRTTAASQDDVARPFPCHLNRIDAVLLLLFLLRTVGLCQRCLLLSNLPVCPTSHSPGSALEMALAPQLTKQRTVTYVLEDLYHYLTYTAKPLTASGLLLQPKLWGITFMIAQVHLPVLHQPALLSPLASICTTCSDSVVSLPVTSLFRLSRDWFSVCAIFSSIKTERGSGHLWLGTGHYNKQRLMIHVRLKGKAGSACLYE